MVKRGCGIIKRGCGIIKRGCGIINWGCGILKRGVCSMAMSSLVDYHLKMIHFLCHFWFPWIVGT